MIYSFLQVFDLAPATGRYLLFSIIGWWICGSDHVGQSIADQFCSDKGVKIIMVYKKSAGLFLADVIHIKTGHICLIRDGIDINNRGLIPHFSVFKSSNQPRTDKQ